jgi:hypothetical protein
MILLVGVQEDTVLQYFAKFLLEKKCPAIFLNQKYLNTSIDLTVEYLRFKSKQFFWNDFSGVLNRMVGLNPGVKHSSVILYRQQCLSYVLNSVLRNVINRPKDGYCNYSKIYQLKEFKKLKIIFPETSLLANSKTERLDDTDVIFKSTSACRSIVKKLKKTNNNVTCPVLFQKFVEGNNIRVHVVNDKIFAQKITSDGVDYRYDKNVNYTSIMLPKDIESDCLTIARTSGLIFTGIDLIQDKQGHYYFLEANPAPGYSFFEKQMSSRDISEALLYRLQG